MKFKSKLIEIEAMQLVGSGGGYNAVYLWVESHVGSFNPLSDDLPIKGIAIDPATGYFLIATIDGVIFAKDSYWVVRNQHGEFYPIHPDIFDEMYEPIDNHTPPKTDFIQEANDLQEAVGLAIGFASLCWRPIPNGVYDSQTAGNMVKELVSWVEGRYEKKDTKQTCDCGSPEYEHTVLFHPEVKHND